MRTRGDDDLDLVLAARAGDADAFGALFDRWFDRVFDVSYRILHDRGIAAEVAQDVFLVAWQKLATLEQPGSFGGWILRTSRNRSLNRLERERRSVALGDEETNAVIDRRTPASDAGAAAEEAEHVDLVWAAARALGERDASVLDLHLRHGFGAPEIAETLGVTTNNAHQLLFRLKDRLAAAIRGWVLWNGGAPSCPGLERVLATDGIDGFGPAAARAINRHAAGCADCDERRELRLKPEAMFAAVPIAIAGPFLRAEAAAALAQQGVPMGGSAAVADAEQADAEHHDAEPGPSEGDEPPHRSQAGDGAAGAASEAADSGDDLGPLGRRRLVHLVMAVAAVSVVAAAVLAFASPVDDGITEIDGTKIDATAPTTVPTDPRSGEPSSTTVPELVDPVTPADGQPADPASPPLVAPERPEPVPPSQGRPAPDPAPNMPDPADRPAPDPIVPPTTAPPSTAPPTTAPPAPVPDPPTIGGFRAVLGPVGSGGCVRARQVSLAWSSDGGTSATITGPGAPVGAQPPSGSAVGCLPPGSTTVPTYTIVVSGPGGSATATATPPAPGR